MIRICIFQPFHAKKTDGGLMIVTPDSLPGRLSTYIVNRLYYNICVSYINGYNDTVILNGRHDLVKPYPEEPEF